MKGFTVSCLELDFSLVEYERMFDMISRIPGLFMINDRPIDALPVYILITSSYQIAMEKPKHSNPEEKQITVLIGKQRPEELPINIIFCTHPDQVAKKICERLEHFFIPPILKPLNLRFLEKRIIYQLEV